MKKIALLVPKGWPTADRLDRLSFVIVDDDAKHADDRIRNPGQYGDNEPDMDDLSIQVWRSDDSPSWTVEIAYSGVYHADLARCERMVAKMRRTSKAHARIVQVEGWPESIGRAIVTAARACGATLATFQRTSVGGFYRDHEHQSMPIADAMPELSKRLPLAERRESA